MKLDRVKLFSAFFSVNRQFFQSARPFTRVVIFRKKNINLNRVLQEIRRFQLPRLRMENIAKTSVYQPTLSDLSFNVFWCTCSGFSCCFKEQNNILPTGCIGLFTSFFQLLQPLEYFVLK